MNKSLTATLKYALSSHKKMNLVAQLVRWKNVDEALNQLQFTPKKWAGILHKVIHSAMSNAKNNLWLDTKSLYIATINIGRGPKLKRVRFVSKSGIHNYVKYRSFVSVELVQK